MVNYGSIAGTRRSFMKASLAALLLPRLGWTEISSSPIRHWKLNDHAGTARESIYGTENAVSGRTGQPIWIGEGHDRALRLDGYSVWINQTRTPIPIKTSNLSLAAWLALESYPVNEAAVVQQVSGSGEGFCFSIDKWGHLCFVRNFTTEAANSYRSEGSIPKGEWVHLAVTVSPSGGPTFYLDGREFRHRMLPMRSAADSVAPLGIMLGKSSDCPLVADIFATGVLNSLIKDVQIFASALSASEVQRLLEESKPSHPPDLQINSNWFADDPQRPLYHAMPPRAWTNEPHGLTHFNGAYHLFYQKNPNGPYWSHIHWGHMTSPDLHQWTEMPVALAPEPGPDAEGCWSGSVIDHDGKLALLYTGGDGKRSSICMAESTDGVQFTKHSGNPVIAQPPPGYGFPDFRDPFVWREGNTYYLLVGSAVEGVGGTALLYRSNDLVSWQYLKQLMAGDKENSGTFWEMPIFVKLGNLHVLIVCEVPGRASYWVGTWKDETFIPNSATPQRLELFNHYLSPTPHANSAGDVITMGIIPEMSSSKDQWQAGWAHLYGIPRVLTLNEDGQLLQNPFEGTGRRSAVVYSDSKIRLTEASPHIFPEISDTSLEIEISLSRLESKSVAVVLRRSKDMREQTIIQYDWRSQTMILDRSKSSLSPVKRLAVQSVAYRPLVPGRLDLRIFLDRSVLEVFVDGRAAFTTRIYPILRESNGLAVCCEGGSAIVDNIRVRSGGLLA